MPRPRHLSPVRVTLPVPRRRYGGLVGSLLFHFALILLLYYVINGDFETVIERGTPLSPQRGGGGGGGGGEFVALPAPPQAPKAAPPPVQRQPEPVVMQSVPVTVPENIPPPVDSVPKAVPEAASSAGGSPGTGPGTGGGTGGGAGTGNGPGTGAGTGPGTGTGGAGGRGRRAESKRQVFPPMESAPKELRGRSISVTFWIGVDGKVLRFEITPPIEDRGYAKKFAEVMREQEFKPARGPDGFPVPDSVTYTWIIN